MRARPGRLRIERWCSGAPVEDDLAELVLRFEALPGALRFVPGVGAVDDGFEVFGVEECGELFEFVGGAHG